MKIHILAIGLMTCFCWSILADSRAHTHNLHFFPERDRAFSDDVTVFRDVAQILAPGIMEIPADFNSARYWEIFNAEEGTALLAPPPSAR